MLEKLISLDRELFLAINRHHTQALDWLMWQVSGNLLWLPLYAFLVYLLVKNFGKNAFYLTLIAILTVGIADFTSVHLFKETFQRLRPCHNPQLQDIVHLVNDHCGGKYGFVSSHASNTFALMAFVSSVLRKKSITVLLFAWATLVAYSRVYLGVHYPADVIGGAIWGALVGYAMFLTLKKIKPSLLKPKINGKSPD